MGFTSATLARLGDWIERGFGCSVVCRDDAADCRPLDGSANSSAYAEASPSISTFADRAALLGKLFGEDFISPGGADEVHRLVRPMGIANNDRFAHLGAGLGGPARLIAKSAGAWVTGFEDEPDFAAAASLASARTALSKRAAIELLQWDEPGLGKSRYQHCLAQEVLNKSRDGGVLLSEVVQAIRPGGHLVLVELTSGGEGLHAGDPTVLAWQRCLGREPRIERAEAITEQLQHTGVDLRIVEEITTRHIKQALKGWMGHVTTLEQSRPRRTEALALVEEAELWLRRCDLLASGKLRLMRWHAIKPSGA